MGLQQILEHETSALSITVANPTDLVKVQLQAEGKRAPGMPKRYSGVLNAYSTIVTQEGVRALWTGLGPNVARNAIINAAELASYDQVKQTILKIPGFTDNIFTHLLSGLGAGFVAVYIGSPVDVHTKGGRKRACWVSGRLRRSSIHLYSPSSPDRPLQIVER